MITIEIMYKYIKYTTIDTSIDFNRFLALKLWFDKLSIDKNNYADTIMIFDMEELWLTFVMYEIYNKKWDVNSQNWKVI